MQIAMMRIIIIATNLAGERGKPGRTAKNPRDLLKERTDSCSNGTRPRLRSLNFVIFFFFVLAPNIPEKTG